jgi:hypothetical protein
MGKGIGTEIEGKLSSGEKLGKRFSSAKLKRLDVLLDCAFSVLLSFAPKP